MVGCSIMALTRTAGSCWQPFTLHVGSSALCKLLLFLGVSIMSVCQVVNLSNQNLTTFCCPDA